MSNYKRNTSSNREALFGAPSSSSGGASKPKKKASTASSRDALFAGASKESSSSASRPTKSSSNVSSSSSSAAAPPPRTGTGYSYAAKKTSSSRGPSVLTGEARAAKMKEAEDYRAKAKKAMGRGVFNKADPIAGSMFYKRAADAYQQCGEVRLERLHRVASADCQMTQGAYATAAADYTRAAELTRVSTEESIERRRKEGCDLHNSAANAYRQMGEMGRAADSVVQAALALVWDDETTLLSKEALATMEKAVEAHVPDPLNRYARYRQLGRSAFVDPDSESDSPTPEMLALAKDHMVTKAYAYEPLHKLVYIFCHYGEYASALYAAGAATAMLEADQISTITLTRNYIMETILLLAMGDPVAAERAFLDFHVQKTFYLTSRECKLAEELFRAVLSRDPDALEEARSPAGSNRAALSNLDESMRILVQQLRISGVARRDVPSTSARAKKQVDEELSKEMLQTAVPAEAAIPKKSKDDDSDSTGSELTNKESSDEESVEEKEEMNAEALHAEMDDLMNDLGLDDGSDDDLDDDDDIDLR